MPKIFFHPYVQLLLTALVGTASEVCLKLGAARTADRPSAVPWLGFSGLESGWVWVGIVLTALSFLTWMQALRTIPLGVAFTLSNVVHVLVPVSCLIFLGETIDTRRWLGIALVVTGLLVIARPFARLDQRL